MATPEQHAAGTAEPVTPAGLQVREVLDMDGDAVLFTASAGDPAQVGLWLAGPGGLTELHPGRGPAWRAAGRAARRWSSAAGWTPRGAEVTVRRDGAPEPQHRVAGRAAAAARPAPVLSYGGPRRLQTAILLPSWHQPGSAPLPVLCDPYGGPHAQRVLAARDAFWTSQWLAEQGFAVVIADGRGTPGRGPGLGAGGGRRPGRAGAGGPGRGAARGGGASAPTWT